VGRLMKQCVDTGSCVPALTGAAGGGDE